MVPRELDTAPLREESPVVHKPAIELPKVSRSPSAALAVWGRLGIAASLMLGAFIIDIAIDKIAPHRNYVAVPTALCFAAAGLVFLFTGIRALTEIVRSAFGKASNSWLEAVGLTVGLLASALGALFAVAGLGAFARGRQLRRHGKLVLPSIKTGADWTTIDRGAEAPRELRQALANHWRENGRNEHASVAAFAQLTLDLLGLGAPPELLADAQRDAIDEIRHAELCFSLARSLDGEAASPAPFPRAKNSRWFPWPANLALARLAVDSLIEGALLEGFSARLLSRLLPKCVDPAAAALLRTLAVDEGRHAKHGWDAVEWCLQKGGELVANALRGALAKLPVEIESDLPAAARDGGWERYGIPGAALERESYLRAREQTVARVESMLRARLAPAA